MKAMRSVIIDERDAKCLRMKTTPKNKKIVVIHNETNWPVHRPVAAVLLQIWIIESYERINQRMVGVLLQIWTVLASCSETNWPVHSPVAAVLLHVWNLPNEMTRKQSCCCSGVAPDLEYTVLLQRCCARSGIYNFSPRFFMILESPSISGLKSQTHFSDFIKFFSQFSIWPFLKFDYPILRMISRRPERLSSWIPQYSLCIYWPVPSLIATAVLLHIWNLPNEMTCKQSCWR